MSIDCARNKTDKKLVCLQRYVEKLLKNSMLHVRQTDEELLIQKVKMIITCMYKNIVETTALHYSGVYDDSVSLYEKLIVEIGRNVIYLIKTIAGYIPVLLKNKKLSRKNKVQRVIVLLGVTVALGLWIKKYFYKVAQRDILKRNFNDFSRIQLEYDAYNMRELDDRLPFHR